MDTPSPSPQRAFGKYEVRGVLGRGAMGTVFDGWDPVIDRRVAIKVVHRPDAGDREAQEGLARFRREAQAAGRLSHPNIVAVYDYGETEADAYIVMEYVEGGSLKDRLDAGDLPKLADTVRIMEQMLAALQASHSHGIVHRDIKPGNVMLSGEGDVKLTDFGIARIENSAMTSAGMMLGTPAYMSPEQLEAAEVDARSDIYSAGVVLYQLLSGKRPFEGGLTAIIHRALNTVPSRPSEMSAGAHPAFDPVVARAMARRPDDRFASAADFARALRLAFEKAGPTMPGPRDRSHDETALAPAPRRPAPTGPALSGPAPSGPAARGQRSPALLAALGAAVLAVAGGGAYLVLHKSGQPSEPQRVQAGSLPVTTPAPPPPQRDVATSTGPPAAASHQEVIAPPERLAEPKPTAEASASHPPPPFPAAPPVAPSEPIPPARPPPAQADTHLALVAPDPAAIRAALEPVAGSAGCAVPSFGVADQGQIHVSGLVGAGEPEAALQQAIAAAAPNAPVIWQATVVDGPYCGALDLIRPLAQPNRPFLGLALKGDPAQLKDRDPIVPVITLPEFPSHLYVAYFSSDGTFIHLFPTQTGADKALAANATLSPPGRWEVGPPFGSDMIIAVASSVPLDARPRPGQHETTQSFLANLQSAIEAAQRQGAKVTGRAIVVRTTEH